MFIGNVKQQAVSGDLAQENGDPTLLETCERLWDNLITERMYLTGAIEPSRHNEGFTLDYDLPDETAYGETCATIGLILWNHRLLQFAGERKYADVIERGLYSGFLSGVALDGAHFRPSLWILRPYPIMPGITARRARCVCGCAPCCDRRLWESSESDARCHHERHRPYRNMPGAENGGSRP
jgi:DUF1680 family protein